MIYDLTRIKRVRSLFYDVCIVGSGPAGLTVANELGTAGFNILVLESGKLKHTRHGDKLRQVLSQGIQIKKYSRERIFGGASTTWSGLSSPLDPIDFKPRPFSPYSSWPISQDDLLPYYEKATQKYGFPSLKFFTLDKFGSLKSKGDHKLSWTELDEKIFLADHRPRNFARNYQHIFKNSNIDLYLDATLIRLERCKDKHGRIASGLVFSSNGREFHFKANIFVLATGGIENARILLNSRDFCTQGLGNENDQVGRYFMNHPKNPHGLIKLKKPLRELPYYFGYLYKGYAGYAGLRFKERIQEELGCLNSYVRFEPLFPWSDNRGVESLVFLVKKAYFFCKNLNKKLKRLFPCETIARQEMIVIFRTTGNRILIGLRPLF